MVDRQGCKGMYLNDRRNLAIFSTIFTTEGSIFQRVGAPTAKALVPILTMTLGTKINLN